MPSAQETVKNLFPQWEKGNANQKILISLTAIGFMGHMFGGKGCLSKQESYFIDSLYYPFGEFVKHIVVVYKKVQNASLEQVYNEAKATLNENVESTALPLAHENVLSTDLVDNVDKEPAPLPLELPTKEKSALNLELSTMDKEPEPLDLELSNEIVQPLESEPVTPANGYVCKMFDDNFKKHAPFIWESKSYINRTEEESNALENNLVPFVNDSGVAVYLTKEEHGRIHKRMDNTKIINSIWYKGKSTSHKNRAVLRKAKELCVQNNVCLQIPKGEKEAMKELIGEDEMLAFFRLSKPYFWQNPFTRAVWQEARERTLAR